MQDAAKKLLIHDINRKLERLSKKYPQSFMQAYYQKIESKVGTSNIYWKTYPDGRKVLGISQSKKSLQILQIPALRDVASSVPTLKQVREEYMDEYMNEQSTSNFDGTIDEFITMMSNINDRIQDFLQKADYKSGDGWFWNAMPRQGAGSKKGSIISYQTIADKLTQLGF